MNAPTRGYWCECWTQDIRSRELPDLKASFDACSAPQADRWIAVALRTISPALGAEASDEAWEWLHNGRAATRRALLRMQPCTVTITQAHTRITWTIRPVAFLPLADRQGIQLPACAHAFSPQATD
ncbi:hypothetical protein [Streptomyces griseoaurantiacus]|uniref:Uncharacterized protein n=1 Tax=Streptomyces griseoaurantiacus TaxID=68213 RepID=A0A1G7NS60_9ACTN|nr:hypothetical protein [Streptomyces jietaisiensis]SDF76816.1 hypothetical protein SAMN05216260_110287 [Streptomyces jietaisiensis]